MCVWVVVWECVSVWYRGVKSHPYSSAASPWQPDCQTLKRKHKKLESMSCARTHTHTFTDRAVRTLVDIIRPDTFLSRFQIRRVCILLNADSVSLFLFPPTQPHSPYLFVLLTCLIPETLQLIRAVQTPLCAGVGGNKDPNKKKEEEKNRDRKDGKTKQCPWDPV